VKGIKTECQDVTFRRFLKVIVIGAYRATVNLKQEIVETAKVWKRSLFFRGVMELFFSFFAGLSVAKLLQITSWIVLPAGWIVLPSLALGVLRYAYWCWRELERIAGKCRT